MVPAVAQGGVAGAGAVALLQATVPSLVAVKLEGFSLDFWVRGMFAAANGLGKGWD